MTNVRSIWNGALSFGLVSIPVKVFNATESHTVHFRQIHLEDGGPIRHRKFCELEEREVKAAEIGRGYQDADGTVIPLTDEDLAVLPLSTAHTMEIVSFVPADRIDPLQLDAAYYLSANGVLAAKPYTLLREVLRRGDKVAVAKFAMRGRERLAMLRVVDDVIVLHTLLWPDEIRAPEGIAPDARVTVRDRELDLANTLVDALGEVDLTDLHDEYREAVEELIAAKASGEQVPTAPTEDDRAGRLLDLVSALESSVRRAQEAREGERPVPEPSRTPGGRTAASGTKAPADAGAPPADTAASADAETASGAGTASGAETASGAKTNGPAAKKTSPRKRAS